MEKAFGFSLALAMVLTFSFAASAQDEKAAKTALYNKFTEAYNRGKEIKKTDTNLAQPGNKAAYQKAARDAYDFAKEYVQKYPAEDDAIAKVQKQYIAHYENVAKSDRKAQLEELVEAKKYDEAFVLGRQILADEPNDLLTLYLLSRAGLFVAFTGSQTHNAAAAEYSRKAIQLVQAGGVLDGEPKEETLGVLNYALGVTIIGTAPSEAASAFRQVATLPNRAKNNPQIFYLLGAAYEAAEYNKPAADFNAQCKTPEQRGAEACKSMLEKLNLVMDRIIDAYARAVSLSGADPMFAKPKPEWLKQLTLYYKYRHDGSEEGLPELIAAVISKPLP